MLAINLLSFFAISFHISTVLNDFDNKSYKIHFLLQNNLDVQI